MKFLKSLIFLCGALVTFGQSFVQEDYTWEESPVMDSLTAKEQTDPYVILKEFKSYEYKPFGIIQTIRYETTHRIIRVNNDKGIEANNTVYIPTSKSEVVEIKARAVAPDGTIKEIPEDAIKDLENVEQYGSFKIFAIEGLTPGSNVEYYYKVKNFEPGNYGSVYFQRNVRAKNVEFELISSKTLTFIAKGYSGIDSIQTSSDSSRNYIRVSQNDIPAANEEKYAAYRANLARVEFTLNENVLLGQKSPYSYEAAGTRFNEVYVGSNNKKEQRLLKKMRKKLTKELKVLEWEALAKEDRVKALENYLKDRGNFVYSEALDNRYADMETIMEERQMNAQGMIRMMIQGLMVMDVNFEMVLTCDRFYASIDPDFETWRLLFQEVLLYLPDFDQYVAPTAYLHRYGMIPAKLTRNQGVFVQPDFEGQAPEVYTKEIKGTSVNQNFDNMLVDIAFNSTFRDIPVTVSREMSGHSSYNLKPQYALASDEDKEKVTDYFVKFMGEDAEVMETKVDGTDPNLSAIEEPFVVGGKITVNSIIERAGRNYLFKLGNVIGPQVEMYQEEQRRNPAEIEYPHKYIRDISFNIPKGYQAKGLEAINFDIAYELENGNKMGFISTYEVKGNKVTVHINEYYNDVTYPLTDFEKFREVINAAADFNKVVIVFEKKAS